MDFEKFSNQIKSSMDETAKSGLGAMVQDFYDKEGIDDTEISKDSKED